MTEDQHDSRDARAMMGVALALLAFAFVLSRFVDDAHAVDVATVFVGVVLIRGTYNVRRRARLADRRHAR